MGDIIPLVLPVVITAAILTWLVIGRICECIENTHESDNDEEEE